MQSMVSSYNVFDLTFQHRFISISYLQISFPVSLHSFYQRPNWSGRTAYRPAEKENWVVTERKLLSSARTTLWLHNYVAYVLFYVFSTGSWGLYKSGKVWENWKFGGKWHFGPWSWEVWDFHNNGQHEICRMGIRRGRKISLKKRDEGMSSRCLVEFKIGVRLWTKSIDPSRKLAVAVRQFWDRLIAKGWHVGLSQKQLKNQTHPFEM